MIYVLRKWMKKLMILSVLVFILSIQYDNVALAAEATLPTEEGSVSGNSATDESVSGNSLPAEPTEEENKVAPTPNVDEESANKTQTEDNAKTTEETEAMKEAEVEIEATAPAQIPVAEKQVISSTQMQTINYKDRILTDWQLIIEALGTLSPEALTGGAGGTLVLQMQNVSDIPAGIKDVLKADGSGNAKALHCNVGYGVSLVFNGNTDNSGFNGISNASATVTSEKRGKRSMQTTVRFGSHENLGTVASLQVNLPQCEEGTKVSVYAETVSVDAAGNVTVGENVCIGNTKADANGNIEVPIQSMANYMFVYKAAKE